MKLTQLLVFCLVCSGCAIPEPVATGSPAQVQRVIDGDTLVLTDGRHIRLWGIDTPERGQPGYQEAKDALEMLCQGGTVRLVEHGKDRYGRTLAEVWVGEREAGMELLEGRLAVEYFGGRRQQ